MRLLAKLAELHKPDPANQNPIQNWPKVLVSPLLVGAVLAVPLYGANRGMNQASATFDEMRDTLG